MTVANEIESFIKLIIYGVLIIAMVKFAYYIIIDKSSEE